MAIIGMLELLLLSVISDQKVAIARPIARKLLEHGHPLSDSAACTTLSKLVNKGWLSKKQLPARPVRGGRPVFKYALTRRGLKVLEKQRQMLLDIWGLALKRHPTSGKILLRMDSDLAALLPTPRRRP